VISKMSGVRDFFVTLFFVSLGLKIPRPTVGLLAISVFAVAVVIVTRLVTVLPTVALLRRGLRTGTVTAINLAQVSEFSLVIVAIGAGYGHVTAGTQSLILVTMLLASVVSTYMINFNDVLARWLLRGLSIAGIRDRSEAEAARSGDSGPAYDIVLLGCFREGRALLDRIEREVPAIRSRVLVADYNPTLQEGYAARGFKWMYVDLANLESLEHLPLKAAKMIICPVSDTFLKGTTNDKLLGKLQELAPAAFCVMTADDRDGAVALERKGAGHVTVPGGLAANDMFAVLRGRI
ncbi:MAG: cation:proton antiporter, partial [bacterium]